MLREGGAAAAAEGVTRAQQGHLTRHQHVHRIPRHDRVALADPVLGGVLRGEGDGSPGA